MHIAGVNVFFLTEVCDLAHLSQCYLCKYLPAECSDKGRGGDLTGVVTLPVEVNEALPPHRVRHR